MRARQRKRLTRQDAARRLSLEVKDIKSIDQWRLDQLPPHVNVNKALRQYALLVGHNPSRYQAYLPVNSPKTYRPSSLISLSRTSLSLAGIILALVAASFIGWRTYVATTSPFLQVDQPQPGQTVDTPKISVTGKTSEQAQVIINGINTPVGADGSFSGEAILSSGPNKIEVRSINSFGRESIETRTIFFKAAP